MGEAVRPAAGGVQHERDPDQRHRVEEVALLEAALEPVGGRLEQEDADQRHRERAEGELLARARAAQRQPEADEGARGEHDARGVGEEHRVEAHPLRELEREEVDVEHALVEAERASGADREEPESRDEEEDEDEQLLPEGCAHPALAQADQDGGREEADGQHGELDAGEGREAGEGEEGELQSRARAGECNRPDRDGAQDERVGERLGNDPAGVDHVRHEDGERCEHERERRADPESPGEQEHGHHGKRHDERAHRLHEAKRGLDVPDEPGGRREDRLEEGGEACRDAADQRPSCLRDGAGKLGVDVLVREEGGRRAQPAEDRAQQEAAGDEAGQDGRGAGLDASEGSSARQHPFGGACGDGHALSIGGPAASIRRTRLGIRPAHERLARLRSAQSPRRCTRVASAAAATFGRRPSRPARQASTAWASSNPTSRTSSQ